MTLDDLLQSTALDVAEQAPTGHPNLREIEERAQSVRARRRVALVSSVTAAVVLVTVAVRLAGGQTTASVPSSRSPPGDRPTRRPCRGRAEDHPRRPTGATTAGDGDQRAGTDRADVRRAGQGQLSYDWNFFCSSDRDTWYVLVVGDGEEGAASGYCNQAKPEPSLPSPADQSPFGHSGEDPTTLRVRMFVTGPIPQQHLDCFDRRTAGRVPNLTPPLEPLTSTDVSFGVSVFEYWAPSVAEVAGEAVSALAVVEGTRHVLRQVVTAAPGESHLTLALPAADRGRPGGCRQASHGRNGRVRGGGHQREGERRVHAPAGDQDR